MKHLAIDIVNEFFIAGGKRYEQLADIGSLVSLFIRIVFVIAGVAILFFFILGGISMITGAGNNNPEQIEKGKQSATSALIGFVVVFVAYWIVQLIELWTGIIIL